MSIRNYCTWVERGKDEWTMPCPPPVLTVLFFSDKQLLWEKKKKHLISSWPFFFPPPFYLDENKQWFWSVTEKKFQEKGKKNIILYFLLDNSFNKIRTSFKMPIQHWEICSKMYNGFGDNFWKWLRVIIFFYKLTHLQNIT